MFSDLLHASIIFRIGPGWWRRIGPTLCDATSST
jgi:hypothetical protein